MQHSPTRIHAIHLLAIGFISILGQVVLLRELNVALYGIELIYTFAIGIWLVSSGIGTIIGLKGRKPSQSHVDLVFLLLSIAIPFGVAFIRGIRILFFSTPGSYLPIHLQILATLFSLFPFGLILGLLFRWTARRYVECGKKLTAAYAWESFGGIAGGLAATIFLKFGVQNFTTGILCALFAAGVTFYPAANSSRPFLRSSASAIIVLCFLGLWNTSALDRFMTSWNHPDIVMTVDSPYSRITITRREQQLVVYENDTLLFDSVGIRSEEFTHLAALQHPNPESILLLGGGLEGGLTHIQQHHPRAVDYVELNPVLLGMARTEFPKSIRNSLESDNVHVYMDDPRRFLQTSSRYDLILANMPEPFSGQANRFYTLEFFRQCSSKLNAEGIVAFRLPWTENYQPPAMIHRMAGVFRAAKAVFTSVMVLPGTDSIFLCSSSPLTDNPTTLITRMHYRNLKSNIVTDAYLRYILTNNRSTEVPALIQASGAPMNTDARPVCYRYTLMIWLSKFWPSSAVWTATVLSESNLHALYAAVFISTVILTILLRRTPWRVRRAIVMGIAGFVGMVLETILLLHFQITNGVLFQDVGTLLTSFMVGLFLGSVVFSYSRRLLPHRTGIWICIGTILLCCGIGLAIGSGYAADLSATFLLLVLAGFVVAATFAYTGLRIPQEQAASIAPLYSADLIGGGLGAFLAGILLVPLAGLDVSAFLIAPISGLSLLLISKK